MAIRAGTGLIDGHNLARERADAERQAIRAGTGLIDGHDSPYQAAQFAQVGRSAPARA